MPKSVRRGRRKASSALRRKVEPRILDRILDAPQLARVVPQLEPELLHRIIQNYGLEECAQLVACATPEQLRRVFDLDLWRPDRPGLDEHLDADRFGEWLEVLLESGASAAARTLVGMDADLVTTALAQHVRVADRAAVTSYTTLDGEQIVPTSSARDWSDCEIGGYAIASTRAGTWDAMVALLLALDAEYPDVFHQVMRGCRRLSNSRPEVDGLDNLLTDEAQDMFDLSLAREERRRERGYISSAQARAFLQMARQVHLGDDPPPRNPIVTAYFRAVQPTKSDHARTLAPRLLPASSRSESAEDSLQEPTEADDVRGLLDLLQQASGSSPRPRALISAREDPTPQLGLIHGLLASAHELGALAHSTRAEELVFLSNTLVAGCAFRGRPFTLQEASDAVMAVCNLGLENWPRQWPRTGPGESVHRGGAATLPEDFLVHQDLVSVFQVGWTILHDEVCMQAADRLVAALTVVKRADDEIQSGLEVLRRDLVRHWRSGVPWLAADALDAIAILDMPAWAALLGLIAECPIMHAAVNAFGDETVRSIDPEVFTFISSNDQIACVDRFLHALPDILRP
jgi:hypothetical protein